jgi:hypothetical protein
METDVLLPAGEALAEIERLLDRVDSRRSGLDAQVRLGWVRAARRVANRIQALAAVLVGEADRARAAERTSGTPLASWLGMGETLSRREAAGAVAQAQTLSAHPEVGHAAIAGRVGVGQVRAITRVLDGLASQLSNTQQQAAEQVMVRLAGCLDAEQLAKSAGTVLAEVAPENAGELLETKLQREVEAAHQARSLRFYVEGASMRFDGSLPRLEAETWIAQLDAHGEALRRTAIEARDPGMELTTAEQRRADALIASIRAAAHSKPVAGVGAARIIVKLDYHQLRDQAAAAGVIGEDQPVSAGELRRACCDAELIPVVLRGESEVLDVGRSARLVTPAIRTALIARDGGCAFPGCHLQPGLCEAHHVTPWWAGGVTSLANLALLCHKHHGLVEPAKFGLRDQWQVEIADDGLPQFIPPARCDPERRPLRHRRHSPPSDRLGGEHRPPRSEEERGKRRAQTRRDSGTEPETPITSSEDRLGDWSNSGARTTGGKGLRHAVGSAH